ncbi:HPr family phosphocarrier protein [Clostridium sediminicola]|uniref:HPr family phosphocarrier protein n=1 Tax=Clostridium sediminicola TaxID=3114879 RepID=UPI0031F258D1
MYEKQVEIINETGLHARPASLFIAEAMKYKSNITLIKGEKTANGKSMLNVLSLGMNKGTVITIKAEGDDEQLAVEKLVDFIANLQD